MYFLLACLFFTLSYINHAQADTECIAPTSVHPEHSRGGHEDFAESRAKAFEKNACRYFSGINAVGIKEIENDLIIYSKDTSLIWTSPDESKDEYLQSFIKIFPFDMDEIAKIIEREEASKLPRARDDKALDGSNENETTERLPKNEVRLTDYQKTFYREFILVCWDTEILTIFAKIAPLDVLIYAAFHNKFALKVPEVAKKIEAWFPHFFLEPEAEPRRQQSRQDSKKIPSFKETPVRWYKYPEGPDFVGVSGKTKPIFFKIEDRHKSMFSQLRRGLDQVARDLHLSSDKLGSGGDLLMGENGLIQLYHNGKNERVREAVLNGIATLSESECSQIIDALPLVDLVEFYDAMYGRLQDPHYWQKADRKSMDIYESDDFDNLLHRDQQFVAREAHKVMIREDDALAVRGFLKKYRKEVRDIHALKKSGKEILKLAAKAREDRRLAYEIDACTSHGMSDLFELEAQVAHRLVQEKVAAYEMGNLSEQDLVEFGKTHGKHLRTADYQKLVSKRRQPTYEQKICVFEDVLNNEPLRKRFGVELKQWHEMEKAYDFDPRKLIKTYESVEREHIQYEGIDILKRYLTAPAYVQPIMGDFSCIVLELNALNKREQAKGLIEYLKNFTAGLIDEFGNQTVAYGKGVITGTAIGVGAQVLGYITPLSVIASKLAFPYMVASGVYSLYQNWEAFKADLDGCKQALLDGRAYDTGKLALRTGADATMAFLGGRILTNTLTTAFKNGMLGDTAKVMQKGGRDTRKVDIAKDVEKRARAEGGMEALYEEYLREAVIPIDKAAFLEQAELLKEVPDFHKPSSPLVKIFLGRKDRSFTGFQYEIDVAVNIKKKDESILNLGRIVKALGLEREFDIMTPTRWIECKSYNWSAQDPKNVLDKLIDQKRIAEYFGKRFELHSKRKIPDDWKKRLNEKGITFFEESLG